MRSIRGIAGDVRAYLRLIVKPSQYKKYNLKHNFLGLFSRRKRDDYYWGFYTDHYVEELKEVSTGHTITLHAGDYAFDAAVLSREANILPLHPNYRLLYETILQLVSCKRQYI